MKKFLQGLIVGISIMAAGTALAETTAVQNMIGQVVDSQYPVYVNGERIDKDAIVIKGTSYLPTAKLAETVGYSVYWDEINETILLDKGVSSISTTASETPMQVLIPAEPTPEPTPAPLTKEQRLLQIDNKIRQLKTFIWGNQAVIDSNNRRMEDDPNLNYTESNKMLEDQIQTYNTQLDALQQEKASLEAQTP